MGLREDAEAARLSAIERREREDQERERLRLQRQEEKRARECDEAVEAGEELGIEFDEGSALWVTDPPVSKGYTSFPRLQLRSEDGVWLRYQQYRKFNSSPVEHQWMVVQKCAYCERWIGSGHYVTTLEGIGRHLTVINDKMNEHIAKVH